MLMKLARLLPKPIKMSIKRTHLRLHRRRLKKAAQRGRGVLETKYMPYDLFPA